MDCFYVLYWCTAQQFRWACCGLSLYSPFWCSKRSRFYCIELGMRGGWLRSLDSVQSIEMAVLYDVWDTIPSRSAGSDKSNPSCLVQINIVAFWSCTSAGCCEWLPRERKIIVALADCPRLCVLLERGEKRKQFIKRWAAFQTVVASAKSGMLSGSS